MADAAKCARPRGDERPSFAGDRWWRRGGGLGAVAIERERHKPLYGRGRGPSGVPGDAGDRHVQQDEVLGSEIGTEMPGCWSTGDEFAETSVAARVQGPHLATGVADGEEIRQCLTGRLEARRLAHRDGEPTPRIVVSEGTFNRGNVLGNLVDEDGGDEIFTRSEVAIERAAADARPFGRP